MVLRPSRYKPAIPAELFDGVSDGSLRTGMNGRGNYRYFEWLDLTVVFFPSMSLHFPDDTKGGESFMLGRRMIRTALLRDT